MANKAVGEAGFAHGMLPDSLVLLCVRAAASLLDGQQLCRMSVFHRSGFYTSTLLAPCGTCSSFSPL